ncbi:STAS domain-containing protein [Streptomyces sp. SID14478]|nr:STAS domain-containing protein [Streptomyces sp. SID14478]
MHLVPLDVSLRRERRSHSTVVLTGEADLETVHEVRAVIEYCLRRPGSRVALDVSALTFCDVTGLNVLLEAAQRAAEQDCHLRLRRPSPQVLRLLMITGSDDVLLTTSSGLHSIRHLLLCLLPVAVPRRRSRQRYQRYSAECRARHRRERRPWWSAKG